MQAAASEAKVFLNGGLVACDIVQAGETVFTATVPQFELWKIRAWLRERKDIDSELRIRAVQKLEVVEAEVWRQVQEAQDKETARVDWSLHAIVIAHFVALLVLVSWMLQTLFFD